jgi:DNA-directed RNA polymerase specialized sigma24 family protein
VPDWTDLELLSALAAQDPRAGLALYDRLIRIVEWTILRVVGSADPDHEDLVQSAFEQIVASLYRRRYARECSLTSWASAISCHIALNALRARRRQRLLGGESLRRDLQPRRAAIWRVSWPRARRWSASAGARAHESHARRGARVARGQRLELTEIARVLGNQRGRGAVAPDARAARALAAARYPGDGRGSDVSPKAQSPLRELCRGVWPVSDAQTEQRRREHIAQRIVTLNRELGGALAAPAAPGLVVGRSSADRQRLSALAARRAARQRARAEPPRRTPRAQRAGVRLVAGEPA